MNIAEKIKNQIKCALKNGDTKSVVMNIIYSFGVKGLSLLIGLFTTPMYIRYFNNNEILGIWFTILSVLSWILNCDMGIGNGLRNKLVGAMASDKPDEGKRFVSSAYLFLCAVSMLVIFIIAILSQFIDWNAVFNISDNELSKDILTRALTILLVSICLQLVLRLITFILYALQQAFVPSLLNLLTNVFMLLFAVVTTRLDVNGSIVNMAIAYLCAVNVPLVITTLFVFLFYRRDLCPSVRFFKLNYAMPILKIGGVFLWIQLMAMVLNGTNSYFVTLFIGNAAVVDYNLYNKLFTLIGTFVTLASTPIWSATTKAQVEKNYQWLYNLFKKFSLIALIGMIADFVLILPLQFVFDFWLGESSINVNYFIALCFAVYGALMIWSSSITCFVNGLGELKLQSVFLTLGAVIDVVLTYILAQITGSYVAIVIANSIAFLPYLFIQTIWLVRYLRKKRYSAVEGDSNV